MLIKESVLAVFTFRDGYIEVREDMPSSTYEHQLGRMFLDDLIRKSNLAYLNWSEFLDAISAVADPERKGGMEAYTRAEELCHDMLWPVVEAVAVAVEPERFQVKRIMRS